MFDNASLQPVSDFRSLVKYDVTTEQIEAKRQQYASLEATNPKGYEEVRKARADCRNTRTAIEERRKELKKVPLEMGRFIDSEAERFTTLIESIEKPLALKLKAVDDEKDRIKREREAAEKAALEAKVRAEREAEEARLKSIRDEEEKRLAEERKRIEEEKAVLAEQKRQQDETARIERERLEAEQKAERDRLAAERAKIEAEQAAERQRQAAIQAEIDERNRAEREKIAAEKARVEAEQAAERERLAEESRKVQAAKDAAERAEFERQARIKAEADAKAKADQEAREAEERRIAELEQKAAEERRLEAIRPDVEKLARFAQQIRDLTPPNCNSESTQAVIVMAMKRLAHTATEIETFVTNNKTAA